MEKGQPTRIDLENLTPEERADLARQLEQLNGSPEQSQAVIEQNPSRPNNNVVEFPAGKNIDSAKAVQPASLSGEVVDIGEARKEILAGVLRGKGFDELKVTPGNAYDVVGELMDSVPEDGKKAA